MAASSSGAAINRRMSQRARLLLAGRRFGGPRRSACFSAPTRAQLSPIMVLGVDGRGWICLLRLNMCLAACRTVDRLAVLGCATGLALLGHHLSAYFHLQFERDAEALAHSGAGQRDQRQNIGGPRAAEVDDEVGVARRKLRLADLLAFQARRLDQPPRIVARRILEDRASAGLGRLRLLAMLL